MQNSILSPLTILVDVERDDEGRAGLDQGALKTVGCLFGLREPWLGDELQAEQLFAASVEEYFRSMLSQCATRVCIPFGPRSDWIGDRFLKRMLSPTCRKLIRFVDRKDEIWKGISEYLMPLVRSDAPASEVDKTRWELYMLALATKQNCELALSPEAAIAWLDEISKAEKVSAEGRARIALLIGVYSSFTERRTEDSLCFLPNPRKINISERIEEILEDSYLLEASRLRRLIGLRENLARSRREQRRLLQFVSAKSSWAKGLLRVGSATFLGGDETFRALEKLVEVIPGFGEAIEGPILTEAAVVPNCPKKVRFSAHRSSDSVVVFPGPELISPGQH